MRLRLATFVGFAALMVAWAAPLGAQLGDRPWPMRGHDARRTGRSEVNGPHTAHLKWRLYLGGPTWGVTGSPVIGKDGTIYVGASSRFLYAITPEGHEKWRFRTGDAIVSAPAIGADGTIYVTCYDGNLYALNPDGSPKWILRGVDFVSASPAIAQDGTIYFGSGDNRLYAVSPNGRVKWTHSVGGYIDQGPAIGLDGTLYFGSWDSRFYAVWPDGTLRWSMEVRGPPIGNAAVGDDGTVYFGEGMNYFYAVAADGQVKWRVDVGGAAMSVAIGHDGTIFGAGSCLYAFSPDGRELWRYRPEGDRAVSNAVGATTPDGLVYLGSFDHAMYALNSRGVKVWSYRTGDVIYGAPAVGHDGTLYTNSADGYVYAFGVIPEHGAWVALLAPALAVFLRTVRRRSGRP